MSYHIWWYCFQLGASPIRPCGIINTNEKDMVLKFDWESPTHVHIPGG